MRDKTTPAEEPVQAHATTIRPADYQSQRVTRVSWSELRIQREEIRLPQIVPPPKHDH